MRQTFCWALTVFFITSLITPPNLHASTIDLPVPGKMLELTKPYMPVMVKGLMVHPEQPFKFDFVVDSGDTGSKGEALKAESLKLIKYFLAALTVPESEMWVNLSPYEKDRIIPKSFGDTEMGRDLLAQDYILKQLTASLTYPEKDMGRKFWDRVYAEAQAKFGTSNIPVNAFNKVWIVPSTAKVYEHSNGAFIVESRLKVMLEQDYLALQKNSVIPAQANIQSQIVKEIIIPALEQEVNEGASFANLRQVYQAMILATWYKIRLKDSILGKLYVDQHKTNGVGVIPAHTAGVPLRGAGIQNIEGIYQQYLQAFKKGVYNYIKEDRGPQGQAMPRKYVSGGAKMDVSAVFGFDNSMMAARRASQGRGELSIVAENTLTGNPKDAAMASQNNISTSAFLSQSTMQRNAWLTGASFDELRYLYADLERERRNGAEAGAKEDHESRLATALRMVLPVMAGKVTVGEFLKMPSIEQGAVAGVMPADRIGYLKTELERIRRNGAESTGTEVDYAKNLEATLSLVQDIIAVSKRDAAMLTEQDRTALRQWVGNVAAGLDRVAADALRTLEIIKMVRPEYIVGGNWKMAVSTEQEAIELIRGIAHELKDVDPRDLDVVVTVAPSFVHLSAVRKELQDLIKAGALKPGLIRLGAQDVSSQAPGAFTSEVSTVQLKDAGVEYVIIGHSERRQQGETNAQVNAKVKKALNDGLKVIMAIGETADQRTTKETMNVLYRQLTEGLKDVPVEQIKNLVVAYEPVWAIGTGKVPTLNDIDDAHLYIRAVLVSLFGIEGAYVPVQYGGSMKPSNAPGILGSPNVHGGLIGGAALKAADFMGIVQAASDQARSDAAMQADLSPHQLAQLEHISRRYVQEVTVKTAGDLVAQGLRGASLDVKKALKSDSPEQRKSDLVALFTKLSVSTSGHAKIKAALAYLNDPKTDFSNTKDLEKQSTGFIKDAADGIAKGTYEKATKASDAILLVRVNEGIGRDEVEESFDARDVVLPDRLKNESAGINAAITQKKNYYISKAQTILSSIVNAIIDVIEGTNAFVTNSGGKSLAEIRKDESGSTSVIVIGKAVEQLGNAPDGYVGQFVTNLGNKAEDFKKQTVKIDGQTYVFYDPELYAKHPEAIEHYLQYLAKARGQTMKKLQEEIVLMKRDRETVFVKALNDIKERYGMEGLTITQIPDGTVAHGLKALLDKDTYQKAFGEDYGPHKTMITVGGSAEGFMVLAVAAGLRSTGAVGGLRVYNALMNENAAGETMQDMGERYNFRTDKKGKDLPKQILDLRAPYGDGEAILKGEKFFRADDVADNEIMGSFSFISNNGVFNVPGVEQDGQGNYNVRTLRIETFHGRRPVVALDRNQVAKDGSVVLAVDAMMMKRVVQVVAQLKQEFASDIDQNIEEALIAFLSEPGASFNEAVAEIKALSTDRAIEETLREDAIRRILDRGIALLNGNGQNNDTDKALVAIPSIDINVPEVRKFVDAEKALMNPDKVVVIDASNIEAVIQSGIEKGILFEAEDGSIGSHSHPADTMRSVPRTFVSSRDPGDKGLNNNWVDSKTVLEKLIPKMQNSMAGKTMYVIPYVAGPADTVGVPGVQVTDSLSVVAQYLILYNEGGSIGKTALDLIAKRGSDFIKVSHSTGDLNAIRRGNKEGEDDRYFVLFTNQKPNGSGDIVDQYGTDIVRLYGSEYGGNGIGAKKFASLRMALAKSMLSENQGTSHSFTFVLEDRATHKTYGYSGSFPSYSGKTNSALLELITSLAEKYNIWMVSDDLMQWTYMEEPDGKGGMRRVMRGVNPEGGAFMVAPGMNAKELSRAMDAISKGGSMSVNLAYKFKIDPKTGRRIITESWWEKYDKPIVFIMLDVAQEFLLAQAGRTDPKGEWYDWKNTLIRDRLNDTVNVEDIKAIVKLEESILKALSERPEKEKNKLFQPETLEGASAKEVEAVRRGFKAMWDVMAIDGKELAHPNSRISISIDKVTNWFGNAKNLPVDQRPEGWDNPHGVKLDFQLYGGRRATTRPLVAVMPDPMMTILHGFFMRAATTAAEEGQAGQEGFDLDALRPFMVGTEGQFAQHKIDRAKWLGKDVPMGAYVNWFKKLRGPDGKLGSFIWPGFKDNSRVMIWLKNFKEGKLRPDEYRETPIGMIPTENASLFDGLNLTPEEKKQLTEFNEAEWREEVGMWIKYSIEKLKMDVPDELRRELEKLAKALKVELPPEWTSALPWVEMQKQKQGADKAMAANAGKIMETLRKSGLEGISQVFGNSEALNSLRLYVEGDPTMSRGQALMDVEQNAGIELAQAEAIIVRADEMKSVDKAMAASSNDIDQVAALLKKAIRAQARPDGRIFVYQGPYNEQVRNLLASFVQTANGIQPGQWALVHGNNAAETEYSYALEKRIGEQQADISSQDKMVLLRQIGPWQQNAIAAEGRVDSLKRGMMLWQIKMKAAMKGFNGDFNLFHPVDVISITALRNIMYRFLAGRIEEDKNSRWVFDIQDGIGKLSNNGGFNDNDRQTLLAWVNSEVATNIVGQLISSGQLADVVRKAVINGRSYGALTGLITDATSESDARYIFMVAGIAGKEAAELIKMVKALRESAEAAAKTVDDKAMAAKGGIDLNSRNLDLQIKRDAKGMPLPVQFQNLDNIKIDGLYPVILNITPVTNLPVLLGLKQTDLVPA